MSAPEAFDGYVCEACDNVLGASAQRCDHCGGALLAEYDLDVVSTVVDATQSDSLWAFSSLLPRGPPPTGTLGEGGTPAVSCPGLADRVGLDELAIKDEGPNPTGSWADRIGALTSSAAVATGADRIELPSTGDDGQAIAAYAARAGIEARVFVPSRTGFVRKAMVNVHGADMRVVGGRYPEALAAYQTEAIDEGVYPAGPPNPLRVEAAATVGYELMLDDESPPDAIICPVATGELLVGVAAAARRLRALGRVEKGPRIYAVQPTGCPPVVRALEAGVKRPESVDGPDTIVGELEIPDPPAGARAVQAVRESGGAGIAVSDDATLSAGAALASRSGIELGLGGAATAAGVEALVQRGELGGEDEVLAINPGAGNKDADLLRSHLMGRGV